ncbi:hypothetical protein PR048_016302 [Dryococelus australis]|uniref:Uncharacterized protein n=1 Tax=Dryococelus australis TaxID=614101 RepID=A0ABQ9HJC5_9NEOP|nr:hypothetical protein PR048_016302 [Dryococelus australis]
MAGLIHLIQVSKQLNAEHEVYTKAPCDERKVEPHADTISHRSSSALMHRCIQLVYDALSSVHAAETIALPSSCVLSCCPSSPLHQTSTPFTALQLDGFHKDCRNVSKYRAAPRDRYYQKILVHPLKSSIIRQGGGGAVTPARSAVGRGWPDRACTEAGSVHASCQCLRATLASELNSGCLATPLKFWELPRKRRKEVRASGSKSPKEPPCYAMPCNALWPRDYQENRVVTRDISVRSSLELQGRYAYVRKPGSDPAGNRTRSALVGAAKAGKKRWWVDTDQLKTIIRTRVHAHLGYLIAEIPFLNDEDWKTHIQAFTNNSLQIFAVHTKDGVEATECKGGENGSASTKPAGKRQHRGNHVAYTWLPGWKSNPVHGLVGDEYSHHWTTATPGNTVRLVNRSFKALTQLRTLTFDLTILLYWNASIQDGNVNRRSPRESSSQVGNCDPGTAAPLTDFPRLDATQIIIAPPAAGRRGNNTHVVVQFITAVRPRLAKDMEEDKCILCGSNLQGGETVDVQRGISTLIEVSKARNNDIHTLSSSARVTLHIRCRKKYTAKQNIKTFKTYRLFCTKEARTPNTKLPKNRRRTVSKVTTCGMCANLEKYCDERRDDWGNDVLCTNLPNRLCVFTFRDTVNKYLTQKWHSEIDPDPKEKKLHIVTAAAAIIRDDIRMITPSTFPRDASPKLDRNLHQIPFESYKPVKNNSGFKSITLNSIARPEEATKIMDKAMSLDLLWAAGYTDKKKPQYDGGLNENLLILRSQVFNREVSCIEATENEDLLKFNTSFQNKCQDLESKSRTRKFWLMCHCMLLDDFKKFTTDSCFTIRRQDKEWSGVWTDINVEQLLMRSIKSLGGLTRGRGLNENTLMRWILCAPIASEIATKDENFADANHNNICLDWLKQHNPFQISEDLVSISSGVVGDSMVSCDFAIEKSKEHMDAPRPGTYGDVIEVYKSYVERHFGKNTVIVFYGYPDSPSTKGEKHTLRYKKKVPEVQFNKHTYQLSKAAFDIHQAIDDAGVLIAKLALHHAADTKSVIVVGQDTVVLVLLTSLSTSENILFRRLQNANKGEIMFDISEQQELYYDVKDVLFPHAMSGCDTTSAIFRNGKAVSQFTEEGSTSVQSMSRQSQCSRVIQAPSCTVGFTRLFHTFSSIHATKTSLAVVLQSPVVVHTYLSSHTLARRPPSKTAGRWVAANMLASSVNVSGTNRREEVCDASKSYRCQHSRDSQKGESGDRQRIVLERGGRATVQFSNGDEAFAIQTPMYPKLFCTFKVKKRGSDTDCKYYVSAELSVNFHHCIAQYGRVSVFNATNSTMRNSTRLHPPFLSTLHSPAKPIFLPFVEIRHTLKQCNRYET